jgi:hypothetical protein
MSYYDHALMMACRLGPWAKKIPAEIDRDIEHAAMLQQRLNPRRPAIHGTVTRMLRLLARGWSGRSYRQPRMHQTTVLGPEPGTDHELPALR